MKQFVKGVLNRLAPQWTAARMSERARAHSHRVVASWGCDSINRRLLEAFGNTVQEGPFAGLILTPMTHAEQIGPFLLGVYESELDGAWEVVFRGAYTRIVDVGAKFGYYAVGLAKRFPHAAVVAYDTDRWARKAVLEMVAANGTANVEVEGFCTPDRLARIDSGAAFIISDCEGYESALFGPETLPHLRTATLIIETHDCFVPGVADRLRKAFAGTHVVREYGLDDVRRKSSRSLEFLTEAERPLAEREVRPAQLWLLCLPRTGPNESLGRGHPEVVS